MQRRVAQPISLVGVGPVVQEQLHWKQGNPRELSEASRTGPLPSSSQEARSKCGTLDLQT